MKVNKESVLNYFIVNMLSDECLCGVTSCQLRYAIYEYLDN